MRKVKSIGQKYIKISDFTVDLFSGLHFLNNSLVFQTEKEEWGNLKGSELVDSTSRPNLIAKNNETLLF